MEYIDLRSDTVTRPSKEMRRAMADADVGDDVLGDDPTVERLQKMIAELLDKEAALYVPSGSMGNAVCIKAQTEPGNEIICERFAHVVNYEVANAAAFSGVQTNMIDGKNGVIFCDQIERLIKTESLHLPGTMLIEIENTHNRAGGTIFPLDEMERIRNLADARKIRVHLDGARLWNAHVATDIPLAEYAACADSVSVCFSKGLGAPIGSCVAGDRDFIERARRVRKMLGGGMRQVGIIAAAAIFAVENNIERLADDHANARFIAEELDSMDGIAIDLDTVQTNIVIFDVGGTDRSAPEVCAAWKDKGVLTLPISETRIRLVCHLDVDFEHCQKAVQRFREIIGS
jgi:threonine aldolase